MILNTILIFTGIAAVASLINLSNKKEKGIKTIPMKIQLPGNLPIIALSNGNGEVLNFIIDSGSNISHICTEYSESLNKEILGTYKNGTVEGLGATNTGVTMCRTTLNDVIGNKYEIDLSISDQLTVVANSIEESTGVKIHGLLGTDFLKRYNCVIDFNSLEVYSKK